MRSTIAKGNFTKKDALLRAVLSNDFGAFDEAMDDIYKDSISLHHNDNHGNREIGPDKKVVIASKRENISKSSASINPDENYRSFALKPKNQTALFREYVRDRYLEASYYYQDDVVKLHEVASSKEMLERIKLEGSRIVITSGGDAIYTAAPQTRSILDRVYEETENEITTNNKKIIREENGDRKRRKIIGDIETDAKTIAEKSVRKALSNVEHLTEDATAAHSSVAHAYGSPEYHRISGRNPIGGADSYDPARAGRLRMPTEQDDLYKHQKPSADAVSEAVATSKKPTQDIVKT